MYVDAYLLFSQAQAVTAAAGSTNTVDLSQASRDLGTGEDLYIVVCNPTILADGGSNAGTVVALEGDSTTSFTPDSTKNLFTFAQAAAAGTTKIYKLSPDDIAYRYLRLKYTPTTADLTGGTFTAFITNDVQKYTSYADGITIS